MLDKTTRKQTYRSRYTYQFYGLGFLIYFYRVQYVPQIDFNMKLVIRIGSYIIRLGPLWQLTQLQDAECLKAHVEYASHVGFFMRFRV